MVRRHLRREAPEETTGPRSDPGASSSLDLVGPGEVSDRLGVARSTVSQWLHRDLLPAPAARLKTGGYGSTAGTPVWSWSTIEAWAQRTGRLPISEAGPYPPKRLDDPPPASTTPDTLEPLNTTGRPMPYPGQYPTHCNDRCHWPPHHTGPHGTVELGTWT